VQHLDKRKTVADVPAIAMKNQDSAARPLTGHKPAVQFQPVFSDESEVLKGETECAGIAFQLPVRVIDEQTLEAVGNHGKPHRKNEKGNEYPMPADQFPGISQLIIPQKCRKSSGNSWQKAF